MIESSIERVEQAGRARALLMSLGGLVLLIDGFILGTSSADIAFTWRGGTWLVLILLWMIVFETGGGLLCSPAMRALMNDERTIAIRARARRTGFWVAMAGAMLLYTFDWWSPIPAREAMRMLTGGALAAALLHYAWLEIR